MLVPLFPSAALRVFAIVVLHLFQKRFAPQPISQMNPFSLKKAEGAIWAIANLDKLRFCGPAIPSLFLPAEYAATD